MANLHGEDLLQKGLPRTSLTPCSLAGRYVTCWWPPPAGTATSPWPASSSLCWTRRTGCWTWASCPTSAAASPTPRCPGRGSVRLSCSPQPSPWRSDGLHLHLQVHLHLHLYLTTLLKVYGLWPGPSWILKERFAPTWKSLLDDANWHTVTKLVARGLNPHLGSFYMSTPCATVQSYPDKEEEKINPSFCDG